MSRTGRVAFLFALCVAVAAQAQVSERKVHLVYDDNSLTQLDRTQLIGALSSQPLEFWDKVRVTKADDGYFKFIEHKYNLSDLTNPEAVSELIREVKNANPQARETLKAGTTLLIPPLPQRAYTINENAKAPLRISPNGTRDMVEASSLMDLLTDSQQLLSRLKDPRDASLTAKEVGDPAAIAQKAWLTPDHPLLPATVHAFDEGEVVRIHLLDAPKCNSTENWLSASPLLSEMQARLQSITSDTSKLQTLKERAAQTPFVIIDWNSSERADYMHEKKVRSVADYVLHELGIALPIVEVDLNPFNDKQRLKDLLSEFADEYYCPKMKLDCKHKKPPELEAAETWLDGRHTAADQIATVNQLVVEAALWRYFQKQRAWVNMSFSIDSRALEIMQADYLASSKSFGVSAANDDRLPESPVGIPQRAASVYPNFINVSYGNLSGQLLGGYSNPMVNVIVTAMGQGCGFQFEDIMKTDAGTSFASPYVAVASWIKFLVDNTDERQMRRTIIGSSTVASDAKPVQIESAGQFDIARLLSKPISTVFFSDGTAKESANVTLRLRFNDSNGLEAEKNFKSGIGAAVSFLLVNGTLHARIRTFNENPPFIPSTDLVDAEVLSAQMVLDGQPTVIDSHADFIRAIVF